MQYKIGQFILDTQHNLLSLPDASVVSDSYRIVQALCLMAAKYPDFVRKDEMIAEIWPDSNIGESSLSRLIADLRKLLATHDGNTDYIKTVHRKGFKLAVAPLPTAENSNDVSQDDKKEQRHNVSADALFKPQHLSKKKIPALFFVGIFATLSIALGIWWYLSNPLQQKIIDYPDLNNKGLEIIAAHTRIFSQTDNYWANGDTPIIYDERGVSLEIKGGEQTLTSHIVGPENAFLSTVMFQVELDQTYKNSGAGIQVFGQNQENTWPGEWDCIIPNSQLVTGLNEVSCQLNEPEAIFNLDDGESMRMGIRSWGENAKGFFTIKHGEAQILPSLSIDRGWYTTSTNQKIEYNNGVYFYPQQRGERLFFYLKGPLNLENTIMHMAISADQEFVESVERIRPFAQSFKKDMPGVWECWIAQEEILASGDTYSCKISSISGAFNLKEGEVMHLGLHVEGRKISGQVGILGVNFESITALNTE